MILFCFLPTYHQIPNWPRESKENAAKSTKDYTKKPQQQQRTWQKRVNLTQDCRNCLSVPMLNLIYVYLLFLINFISNIIAYLYEILST